MPVGGGDSGVEPAAVGAGSGVLLRGEEKPPGGWTGRAALEAWEEAYFVRSRVAVEWRQHARETERQAEAAKRRRVDAGRELSQTRKSLEGMTWEREEYRGRAHSWKDWYAFHGGQCAVLRRS